MLEVSPVRAFSDNYIWLIRAPGDPAGAAVVDPGDARPAVSASPFRAHIAEPAENRDLRPNAKG